jgi:hypothetical protein
MDALLQSASRAEELRAMDDPRSRYVYGEIFEPKGFWANWRNKTRLAILQGIDADLQRILHDGERVRAVTRAHEFAGFEFHGAAWSQDVNRRALILTDERLIQLQLTGRNESRFLFGQARHGAIAAVTSGFLGRLRLDFALGRRLLFTQLPTGASKSLAEQLESLRRAAPQERAGAPEYLCPFCFDAIAELVTECPKCRGAFKTPRKAVSRALLLPGLGDWYLGYRLYGGFQIFGSLCLWTAVLAAVWGAQRLDVLPFFMLFAAVHGANAAMTLRTARRGLYGEKPGPMAGSRR